MLRVILCAGIVALGMAFAPEARAEAATATFSVRYQDILLLDHQSVDIPAVGTVTISTQDGIERVVNAQSVLGMLISLDRANDSFRISKATYYPWSPPSVYVNCIFVESPQTDACENWLYAVNGQDPQIGMDAYVPQAGSQVFLYFGVSKRVSAAGTSVAPDSPFTLASQQYLFETNEWGPLGGVTIGITQPNLADPFSPVEVVTAAVDGIGNAVFSLAGVGRYDAGIKEDYYTFKLPITVYNPIGGVISAVAATAVGGTVPPTPATPAAVRVEKAVEFLLSYQDGDGSFLQSQRLTDWAAIALGAHDSAGSAAGRVRSYLLVNPDPGSLPTDFERRAMALMALGVNPYNGTSTDYIAKIIAAFDGTQIGDPSLFNDDIFGLLVLLRAGYASADPVVSKTAEFIMSKQQADGSFIGVDMTAAAIQALVLVQENPGVAGALQKASAYLASNLGSDGGFAGSVASAAWAGQAMSALGSEASMVRSYLAIKQAEDGGWAPREAAGSRVWETS
ncbi:MAG: terpene cyclase/mutase family protein, partial [Candidatus Wildermuthbacteria bacterium]|nr:terpene cyclase/mutase family protein [Candidatus Wildermuthbacteria bacterium]